MKSFLKQVKEQFFFLFLIPFLSTIIPFICMIFGYVNIWTRLSYLPILIGLYILNRKKITRNIVIGHYIWLVLSLLVIITLCLCKHGGMETGLMMNAFIVLFPYFLFHFVHSIYGEIALGVLVTLLGVFVQCALAFLFAGNTFSRKTVSLCSSILLVFTICYGYLYANRPEVKYAGHGFAYMRGYSSTDFNGYHVYDEPSRLANLDHPAQLQITSDYPVLDGAEACDPLYSSIAKETYVDIAEIEKEAEKSKDNYTNGRYVSFTNSVEAFYRLIYADVDMVFGARPSREQLAQARDAKVSLEVTPIGKEGFVFFVEDDNPVQNLTSEQVKAIYHGTITNWKEVGGKDQEIIAFQRPANSGSQAMMEYFMDDVSLKEPLTYERVSSMEGVIQQVAQYHHEAGSIGYTFRYFLEGLNQEKGVRMLSIDGVYPTRETISDGSYPLTVDLCVTYRKNSENENIQKLVDFILSEDGQDLVYQTGYSKLH